MKRFISSLVIVMAISLPVAAGDIPTPGVVACTESCTPTSTATASTIPAEILLLLAQLLGTRI